MIERFERSKNLLGSDVCHSAANGKILPTFKGKKIYLPISGLTWAEIIKNFCVGLERLAIYESGAVDRDHRKHLRRVVYDSDVHRRRVSINSDFADLHGSVRCRDEVVGVTEGWHKRERECAD